MVETIWSGKRTHIQKNKGHHSHNETSAHGKRENIFSNQINYETIKKIQTQRYSSAEHKHPHYFFCTDS